MFHLHANFIICIFLPLILIQETNATNFNYYVGGAVKQYDNINLEVEPINDEVTYNIVAGLKANEDTANLSTDISLAITSIN